MRRQNNPSQWSLTAPKAKKFDDWKFKSPFDGDKPIHVEVRLENADDRLLFVARVISPDPAYKLPVDVKWSSPSLDELHQLVRDGLDRVVQVMTGASWEDWLEVRVSGRDSYGSPINGRQLEMEYSTIKRGMHPAFPGKVFRLLESHNMVGDFPSPKEANKPDPDVETPKSDNWWDNLGGRDIRYEYSYVKDTPENRAALDSVIEAMRQLHVRLSEVLRQDSVIHFLAGVNSGHKALPNLEQ